MTGPSYVLSAWRWQLATRLVPAAVVTVLSLAVAVAGGEPAALVVLPLFHCLLWWYLLTNVVVRAEVTRDELVLTMPARSVRLPLADVDVVVPWLGGPSVRRRGRLSGWALPPSEEATYVAEFVRGAQAAPARRPVL